MQNPFQTLDRRLRIIEERQNQILSLVQTSQKLDGYPQRMTVPKAMAYLGDTPKATIYAWIRRGNLTAHKAGKKILIDRNELDRFILQKSRKNQ